MNRSGPIIGMSAIGFGILLMWSAYTKKPLFGTDGLITAYFSTRSFEQAGKTVRKTVNKNPSPVSPPTVVTV